MSKKLFWKTEKRKVKDLIQYKKNPRKLSEDQLEGLKRSLKKFNVAELPCINTDGTLVAGNQRVLALSLLGRDEDEIEVRVPNRPLTEAEFRDYLLTSNRSGASWDFEKLASDFDIDELLTAGFDSLDLENIFDNNLEVVDDDVDIEKELKEAKTTDIKSGDMFSFGKHFLICADSTDPNTVKKLVGKDQIDLINIDFPYNLGIDYSAGLGGKQNYGGTMNDKKSDPEYREFLTSILSNALSVTKVDCHVFTWLDEKYLGMMHVRSPIFKTKSKPINFILTCGEFFSKFAWRHSERGVNSGRIVDMNCFVNLIHQFSQIIKSVRVSEVNFKLVIETFLISVLPGRTLF